MVELHQTARHAGAPRPLNVSSCERQRFGFLLVHRFTLTGFSAAIEPLRMANMAANRTVFSAFTVSLDGNPVAASNGTRILPDYSIDSMPTVDILLVCGANPIQYPDVDRLKSWLHNLARSGTMLGSIDSGSDLLARAGLLDGYRCTIHWQDLQLARARYRRALFSNQMFEIDRDRMTAGGGTAAADMVFELIRRAEDGEQLAAAAADLLVYDRIRQGNDRQRAALGPKSDVEQQGLSEAIAIIEGSLDHPPPVDELAACVNLSRRRLVQLFREHLDCTPTQYCRELRLKEARQHVIFSNARIGEIARLCGFRSSSYFTRCYADFFGTNPRDERERAQSDLLQASEDP